QKEIGFAVRHTGWQAHHGSNRNASEDNGTNIRHATVGNGLKQRMKFDPVFNQRLIRLPTQTVQSTEYIRNVIFDIFFSQQIATILPVTAVETPGYDTDATSSRAMCRLDHEILVIFDDIRKTGNIMLNFDDTIQFRHRDAGRSRQVIGPQLVVDQRIK